MASNVDVSRFENIFRAAGLQPGDSEVDRLVPHGEAAPANADELLASLNTLEDLDHIPRYVLIGRGEGDMWGNFQYVDSLDALRSTAIEMKDDDEEITCVFAHDLDSDGEQVAEYTENWWHDYWDDEYGYDEEEEEEEEYEDGFDM